MAECPLPLAIAPNPCHTNSMKTNNPYVNTLIEMGYDVADCQTVASAGLKKTFPLNIHGRVYNTQAEYDEALADFLNGL